MKVKRELNEIMELSNRLCNADALCDGSCNAVPEELSEYYDVSEYANIVKNYIIYFLFSKFKLCQRDFHKKIGLSVKGNHDRAEKYIDLFKADSEKIFRPFITARADDMFSVTKAVRCQTDFLTAVFTRFIPKTEIYGYLWQTIRSSLCLIPMLILCPMQDE